MRLVAKVQYQDAYGLPVSGSSRSYISGGMSCSSALTATIEAVAELGDVTQHLDAAVALGDDVHAGVSALERRRQAVERHDEAAGVR